MQPQAIPPSCLHLPAKSKAANPSWGPGPRAVMPDALPETVETPHESGPEALSGPPHLHTTPAKPPEPGCMSLGRDHYRGADKDSELGAQSATCVSLPPALGSGQCQRPEVRGTGPAGAQRHPGPACCTGGTRAERPHETKPDLTLSHIPPIWEPDLGDSWQDLRQGRRRAGWSSGYAGAGPPHCGTGQLRSSCPVRRPRGAQRWPRAPDSIRLEGDGGPELRGDAPQGREGRACRARPVMSPLRNRTQRPGRRAAPTQRLPPTLLAAALLCHPGYPTRKDTPVPPGAANLGRELAGWGAHEAGLRAQTGHRTRPRGLTHRAADNKVWPAGKSRVPTPNSRRLFSGLVRPAGCQSGHVSPRAGWAGTGRAGHQRVTHPHT